MGVRSDNSMSPITLATINISTPPTEGEEDNMLSEGGGGAAPQPCPPALSLGQSFHSLDLITVTLHET